MKTKIRSYLKEMARFVLPQFIILSLKRHKLQKPMAKRFCNICGYRGWFLEVGRPPRIDGYCPKCHSMERHRLMVLAFENELDAELQSSSRVLHFAPEECLEPLIKRKFDYYDTADIKNSADLQLNIESIDLPDSSYDLVLAHQVLEHVNDGEALKEINRVLSDHGVFVCSVPIVEGWEKTYENSDITAESERWVHFGQGDHIRCYGRDFTARVEVHGFELMTAYTGSPEEVANYGLIRGEKIFAFKKICQGS